MNLSFSIPFPRCLSGRISYLSKSSQSKMWVQIPFSPLQSCSNKHPRRDSNWSGSFSLNLQTTPIILFGASTGSRLFARF